MAKLSWAQLHRLPVDQRWRAAAEALYEARRKGASFFASDGTIIPVAAELYSLLFTGVKKPSQIQGLTRLLKQKGVLDSDGQRGRGGATLRLIQPDSTTEERPEEQIAQSGKTVVAESAAEQLDGASNAPDSEVSDGKPEDALASAYQRVQSAFVENRRELTDLEVAMAIRELLVAKGLKPSDLGRIVKVLKDHSA